MKGGVWPGELVKQYGCFRLYVSVYLSDKGILTSTNRYRLLLENNQNEPLEITSIEHEKSDLVGLIAHIREWQRMQNSLITRMEQHIAMLEGRGQKASQQQKLEELQERYIIVTSALRELEEEVCNAS